MSVDLAYNQAIQTGRYAKPSGLCGKYDNVRRFWEDEVTRAFCRPFLAALSRRREDLRVCDLGCGSGDGWELLTGPANPAAAPGGEQTGLLPAEKISAYHGIDRNELLLVQARELYGSNPKTAFIRGDFLEGLPVKEEPPYDLYLANYGVPSHCQDGQLVVLLAEIARHARDGSLVILDWLGAYSYEWQDLWEPEPIPDQMINYLISYLGDEGKNVQAFPLRLMDQRTARDLVEKAARAAGATIKIHLFFDRSLFVGRHIETGHYHPDPQPLRQTVNSLFEQGQRTDLTRLVIRYHPRAGFGQLNDFFVSFVEKWNIMVYWTLTCLTGKSEPLPETSDGFLRQALQTMQLLCAGTLPLPLEDVPANIIEPQLAYLLRMLEMHCQRGIGTGHGLGAVLEIKK